MATLDDLHYVAVALRTDVRSGLDEIIKELNASGGGGGTGGGGTGGGGTGGGGSGSTGLAGRLDKFAAQMTKAGAALAGFTVMFDRMMSALNQQLTKFVALANPAVVIRFNMALDNAMSAMGRVLIPVMERFTLIIQQLGNAIESLSPQAKSMIAALAAGGGLTTALAAVATGVTLLVRVLGIWPTIIVAVVGAFAGVLTTMSEGKELAGALRSILQAVGSVVEVLAQIFVVVFVPVVKLVARVVQEVASTITFIIRELASAVGIQLPDYDPTRKQATAVRQSQVTSLQGFANRAYSQAFGGAGENIQSQLLGEAKKHTSSLEKIANSLGGAGAKGGEGARGAVVGRALGEQVGMPGLGTIIGLQAGNVLGRMRSLFGS